MRDHPAIEDESGDQEPHSRQSKRRNFVNTNANRKKSRAPNKIDDGESQQRLPGRTMGFGFHRERYEHRHNKCISLVRHLTIHHTALSPAILRRSSLAEVNRDKKIAPRGTRRLSGSKRSSGVGSTRLKKTNDFTRLWHASRLFL